MATSSKRPTVPPPEPKGLSSALTRNIAALKARARAEESRSSSQEKLAQAVTAFTGSMTFVYVHLVILIAWVSANVGVLPGAPQFDKSFVILATAASVEAIFLSTFVLISQNRASAAADKRSDLDLQINLLAEHEITRLIQLTSAIATHLGLPDGQAEELSELKRDVAPETVLDSLEQKDAEEL